MQKDFMSLRGIFSNFFHKYNAIKREPNFDNKPKRDSLTKLMYHFISDRNIYTHGVLRILRPEDIFVIDYIEEKKQFVRCKVTIEIMESFLRISDLIRSLLNQVGDFYRKSKEADKNE